MEEGLLELDVLPAHHPLHFIPELKIISHLSTYRCWFEEKYKKYIWSRRGWNLGGIEDSLAGMCHMLVSRRDGRNLKHIFLESFQCIWNWTIIENNDNKGGPPRPILQFVYHLFKRNYERNCLDLKLYLTRYSLKLKLMLKLIKMIFCKRTFLLQFFDWWQVSATVEVKKGLVLASEITIVNVT